MTVAAGATQVGYLALLFMFLYAAAKTPLLEVDGSLPSNPLALRSRIRELRLLVLVEAVAFMGFAILSLDRPTSSLEDLGPAAVASVVGFALWAVSVARGRCGDEALLPLMLALVAFGMVQLAAMTPPLLAEGRIGKRLDQQQLQWLVVAGVLIAGILAASFDIEDLARLKYTLGFLVVPGLLALPRLPLVGHEENGAYISVSMPGGYTFQTAEVAKILVAAWCASFLAWFANRMALPMRRLGVVIPPLPYFRPIFWMTALTVGILVFSKDFGASLVIFIIVIGLVYVVTDQIVYPAVGTALFVAAAATATVYSADHLGVRITGWLADPFDPSFPVADLLARPFFQLTQFVFALGASPIGAGLGHGLYIQAPSVWNDGILVAIAEDAGIPGAFWVIGVYATITWRALRVAEYAHTEFQQLLGTGLTLALAAPVLLVFFGDAKVLPLAGLSAPFLASGGSSLLANAAIVGLLLRISHQTMELSRKIRLSALDTGAAA